MDLLKYLPSRNMDIMSVYIAKAIISARLPHVAFTLLGLLIFEHRDFISCSFFYDSQRQEAVYLSEESLPKALCPTRKGKAFVSCHGVLHVITELKVQQ